MKAPTPARSTVTAVQGLLMIAALSTLPSLVAGQTHQTIHSFPSAFQSGPFDALLLASNGKWYGLTQGGPSAKGTIYTLTPDGQGGFAFEEIHVFRGGVDGEYPRGGLVEASDGYLYGVTILGGALGRGTVYRLDPTGNTTIVHSFSTDEGTFPSARLIQASDGFLYGSAPGDGEHGSGSVFRIDISSGALTVVHAFTQEEGHPGGPLVETSDGQFCGTSQLYPSSPFPSVGPLPGWVFRVDTAGSLTILHEFSEEDDETPQGGLVLASDGYLYGGTTSVLGPDYGTVFRIRPDGTGFETVHSFDLSVGINHPLVEGPDGFLYGVTPYGGDGNSGTVIRVGTDGSFESILSFSSDGPHRPSGPLALDGDGFLGPANGGPAGTIGTVYRLDDSFTVTAIREFVALEFSYPAGELVEAADGKLYGTASGGGPSSMGAIYRTDLGGNVEVVHPATETDGNPYGWLTEGTDGFLYGTSTNGYVANRGTFYRLSLDGDFTVLHQFTDQEYGAQNLFEASDGYLYASSENRVFRFSKAGGAPTIWSSSFGPSYFFPELVESGGFLWGTVSNNEGGIFRVDLQGNFTFPNPYKFTGGGDGCCPAAGLTHGSDGNFYGTTYLGGSADAGTVFRYEPQGGVLTTLYTFAGRLAGDGQSPSGRLLEGGDGYLYGITNGGGLYDLGTVFRIRMAGGGETVLHHFGGPGDANAYVYSGLIRASDGNLYGTSASGGEFGGGAIYRIDPEQVVPITSIAPDSGPAGGGTTIAIQGGPFEAEASVWIGHMEGDVTIANGSAGEDLTAVVPALPPGTLNHVFVRNPDGTTGSLSSAWLADFLDVPQSSIFHDAVESLVRNGISAGCGNGQFCPGAFLTRAQLAVLLLKATQGATYVPPSFTGTFFDDVHWWAFGATWIEDLARRGVTAGCGNGNYCPDSPVTRDQMAVFLLKALLGSAYTPPAATGVFADVPPGSFAADWIEDLHTRSITAGCATAPLRYCPSLDVTRGQMAGFLTNTFGM